MNKIDLMQKCPEVVKILKKSLFLFYFDYLLFKIIHNQVKSKVQKCTSNTYAVQRITSCMYVRPFNKGQYQVHLPA
jgi:hypothetical protein